MCSDASKRFGALAVVAAALAACATPVVYGPIGANGGYGYSDMRNTDGSHTIRIVSPNAVMAHQFWDRRAGELCGGANFRKNIFRAEIPVVTTTGYAANPYNPGYGGSYTQDVYGALILEGYVRCENETTQTDAAATAETTAAPGDASAAPADASLAPAESQQ